MVCSLLIVFLGFRNPAGVLRKEASVARGGPRSAHGRRNPAPWHPPAPAGGGKRLLARDTTVSRKREFAVPPCTPAIAVVNAGCKREVALFEGASGSCRRGSTEQIAFDRMGHSKAFCSFCREKKTGRAWGRRIFFVKIPRELYFEKFRDIITGKRRLYPQGVHPMTQQRESANPGHPGATCYNFRANPYSPGGTGKAGRKYSSGEPIRALTRTCPS